VVFFMQAMNDYFLFSFYFRLE